MAMTPYQRVLAARKRARTLGTKRKGKPLTYSRSKRGRTGGKRRARTDTMQRTSAPVSRGTKVTKGGRGPAGVGYSMQQVSDTCTRITGRAYIGEVSTKGKVTTAGGNAVGLVFDINPALLNDRVAVIASTFEKYVYHGVKFTYVPQCATSVSGSVGLVFDRDPLQYAACINNGQFLAEVMSYEHAVLTPGYVGASTTYTRDPMELKTWYVSSPDATLSTRETSQGNFITYISNGEPEKGYGFVVMDYVLDLVAPNLLPNKSKVSDNKSAPSQWRDFSGINSGVGGTLFTVMSQLRQPVGTATVRYCMWNPASTWVATCGTDYCKPGAIGEFIFGGLATSTGNTNTLLTTPFFKDSSDQAFGIKHGQKLYFCVHSVSIGSLADVIAFTFHTTLSGARAASGQSWQDTNTGAGVNAVLPEACYTDNSNQGFDCGGWMRLITDGTSGVSNEA